MNTSFTLLLAVVVLTIYAVNGTTINDQHSPSALKVVSAHTGTTDNEKDEDAPLALPLTGIAQNDERKGKSVGEIWEEDDHEVLIRNERGAKEDGNNGKKRKNKKNKSSGNSEPINTEKTNANQKPTDSPCRYVKSPWTECDTKSNTRSRTLTLKKGEEGCDKVRTIQKKCKKACRYEKGSWSECTSGQMSRIDKLKNNAEPNCQSTRVINKNCNSTKKGEKKDRKNKEKGNRKNRS